MGRMFSVGNRRSLSAFAEKRDEAGFLTDDMLTYDTNVYCQNLGGTAQLPFTDEAQAHADGLKANAKNVDSASTLDIINNNFEYLAVSYSIGDVSVAKGDRADESKLLSFCILAGIKVETAAKLTGNSELASNGWGYVKFPNGLSVYPKGSAYDYETDPTDLLNDASTIGRGDDWDPNSDIWIP